MEYESKRKATKLQLEMDSYTIKMNSYINLNIEEHPTIQIQKLTQHIKQFITPNIVFTLETQTEKPTFNWLRSISLFLGKCLGYSFVGIIIALLVLFNS
jgi:hypothetical protein